MEENNSNINSLNEGPDITPDLLADHHETYLRHLGSCGNQKNYVTEFSNNLHAIQDEIIASVSYLLLKHICLMRHGGGNANFRCFPDKKAEPAGSAETPSLPPHFPIVIPSFS